jgi:hypothetical protein
MKIKSKFIVYAYSISVCMGSFVFGYSLSSTSNLFDIMETHNNYEDDEKRSRSLLLIENILALSAIFGNIEIIKAFHYIDF